MTANTPVGSNYPTPQMMGAWKPGDRCVLVTLNMADPGPHQGIVETIDVDGDQCVVLRDNGRRFRSRLSSSFVQRPKTNS